MAASPSGLPLPLPLCLGEVEVHHCCLGRTRRSCQWWSRPIKWKWKDAQQRLHFLRRMNFFTRPRNRSTNVFFFLFFYCVQASDTQLWWPWLSSDYTVPEMDHCIVWSQHQSDMDAGEEKQFMILCVPLPLWKKIQDSQIQHKQVLPSGHGLLHQLWSLPLFSSLSLHILLLCVDVDRLLHIHISMVGSCSDTSVRWDSHRLVAGLSGITASLLLSSNCVPLSTGSRARTFRTNWSGSSLLLTAGSEPY